MADNSKIPLDKRMIGRIKSFEFALTVVTNEADRQVILERIAQLKCKLSSLKGDE